MSVVRGPDDAVATANDRPTAARPDDVPTLVPGGTPVSAESTLGGEHDSARSTEPGELLQVGRTIGHFVIERLLGSGAMGVVVLAHDHELDRPVAIKLLRSDERGVAQARLLREAQSVARVSHPNVVAVHQVGMIAEQVYLVMEYVDGGTLREWSAARTRGWHEVLEVYRQAARGLAAAHAAGLVHRDFKPDNVLIGQDRRVRVSDFGLVGMTAEAMSSSSSREELRSSRLTRTGSILGTPAYMAPEQYGGGPVDARSDQFALCVSMFEALCGMRPFAGDTLAAVLRAIEGGHIRTPPRGRAVPPWVTAALHQGLRADPRERHASIEALLRALEPPARRHPMVLVGALGLATSGVVVTAVLMREPVVEPVAVAVPQCPAPGDAPGDPWSSARREEVHAALSRTGHADAELVFVSVDAELSARRSEWRAELDDACQATLVRGEQSPSTRELRERCLADVRDEADAFAELLTGDDTRLRGGAISTATTLTPASSCRDTERLQGIAPPSPPQLAELATLRRELLRARVLLLAGRHHDAITLAGELEPRARALGLPAEHAALLLLLARARMQIGESTLADAELREAIGAAAKARAYITESLATTTLMYVVAAGQGRPQEALGMLAAAQAAALRSGDPRTRAYLEAASCTILFANEKPVEAMRACDRAIELLETLPRPPPDELGMAYSNRAGIELQRGDVAKAIADHSHGLELIERGLGRDHPFYAALSLALGRTLAATGDPAGALVHARDALAAWEASLGRDHTSCALALLDIARDEMALQRWDDARAALDDALARHERASDGAADLRTRIDIVDHRAFVDVQTARYDQAFDGYTRARELVITSAGAADPRVSGYDRALAGVRVTQGRYYDALPLLERARAALVELHGPAHPEVIDALVMLGDVELATRDCDHSIIHLRSALELRNQLGLAPDAALAKLLLGMASCELQQGDDAACSERLDQAEPLLVTHPDGAQSARLASLRAELSWHRGEHERARAQAVRARDGYGELGPEYVPDRTRIELWLEQHPAR